MSTIFIRRGGPMIRIYLPYVFGLSENLERLASIRPGVKLDSVLIDIWTAQTTLETLLSSSVFAATLRSSRQLAQMLIAKLAEQEKDSTDWSAPLGASEAFGITTLYAQFKTAFLAEIGTFPSYFVSQKGSHDTLTLLDQPWRMFPADLEDKAPEAMFDVAEAGKALCYEMATACGFHLFRATEAVLRRYYGHVTNGAPPPKVRNISVYIHAMRMKKCGDERVLSVLHQLSTLHRNPLIHPEVALTIDEAISILGMAHSSITAMLGVLPKMPPTTATTRGATI